MKLLKVILVAALLLNLTGCWSKIELDELTFIYGLYVDAGEQPGTVELTISSPLPNRLMSGTQGGSGAGDGKSYSTVSKTSATIPEAAILIQQDLSRRLEVSHLKVVVVGREYAKQGIGDLLEWLKRQPEIPLGTFIISAPGRAKEIPRLSTVFEQFPDQVLENIIKGNIMYSTTLRDCMLAESAGMGYAMNYLTFGKKNEAQGQAKPEYWVGSGGVMLFQDNRMKHILNIRDGRSLAWAAGRIAGHAKFPVYTITWEDNGTGSMSTVFLSNSASTSVRMTTDGPVFHVKVKGRAGLTFLKDTKGRKAEQLSPLLLTKLQDKVVKEITEALHQVQRSEADVLQLGMLMEWNYPTEWKKLKEHWLEYYSKKARIMVSAKFQIADFGSEK
ncbi:Ger(x)C family spore germination protein [Paenibacillus sp. FSL H3-0333]|uniref:Ger(x)C family spore germination protein n=1 Tax=Paenibacillus sp. FSL H3-0333 TaxID=2921373 RepID=UPI0030F73222